MKESTVNKITATVLTTGVLLCGASYAADAPTPATTVLGVCTVVGTATTKLALDKESQRR